MILYHLEASGDTRDRVVSKSRVGVVVKSSLNSVVVDAVEEPLEVDVVCYLVIFDVDRWVGVDYSG